MLDSYYKQAKEREQIGVVPKPLSASDVEELIAVLQDPGAESREELLNLIENRIPPGVDEAAKVKAAFLNDLATGRKTSPVLSKQKAVELLGTMQGGYNVQYLLDLLKDEQLAQTAAPLTRLRAQMSERLSAMAATHYRAISGRDEEALRIRYMTQLTEADLSQQMLRLLQARRHDDFRRLSTSVGPHRDDLLLTLSGESLQSYASQGQSRTAALSMKLAAFDLLTEEQGEPPLLLLDDVLSELDPLRRRRLIDRIRGAQALLTCTDVSDLNGAEPNCILHVGHGTVTE